MDASAGVLIFAMGVVIGAVLGAGVAFVYTSRMYVRLARRRRDD